MIQPVQFFLRPEWLLICLCLGLISCASTPEFTSLPQAREAISAVRPAGDGDEADQNLQIANSRLQLAEQALEAGQPVIAERYVAEAIAHAEYAQALKRAQHARNELETLKSNFNSLQHELEWREPLNVSPLQ